jgi:hypothetical protein
VHEYDKDRTDRPAVPNVNNSIITFVAQQRKQLLDSVPIYRSAFAAEWLLYRVPNGCPVDLPLESPNTSLTLKSLSRGATSHLGLLVSTDPVMPADQATLTWPQHESV